MADGRYGYARVVEVQNPRAPRRQQPGVARPRAPAPRKQAPKRRFGAISIACTALACGWGAYNNFAPTAGPVAVLSEKQAFVAEPVRPAAPLFDVALISPSYALGNPTTFSANAPTRLGQRFLTREAMQAEFAAAAPATQPQETTIVRTVSVPMPQRRPAELAALEPPKATLAQMAQRKKVVTASVGETIFQKIFGKPQDTSTALAYAGGADGGVFDDGQSKTPGRLPATDETTAVYDITARTVYMPDGTKLEAHSGLRDKLDDPRYVNVRMWGPTPPHTYDLVMRESLFHGVQALRLIPVGGEGAIYGRSGLLAHTYMLGPNGDSNGCVSFKDYNAFLHAFKSGKVKRLVVVARGGRNVLASNN